MTTMLGLDDELTLRAKHSQGFDHRAETVAAPAWRICHEPVWNELRGTTITGLADQYARESDALRAIAALKAAGFTTARRLWFEREERNRIIGESMAW